MITLLFVALGVLICLNSPISLALGLASTITAAVQGKGPLLFIPQKVYTALDSFPLLAVPLFILAGSFLETGGVGRRLVNLANVMVRHLPGGLGSSAARNPASRLSPKCTKVTRRSVSVGWLRETWSTF